MAAVWPLVGRDDALETIARAAATGSGAVVLSGGPGVGKSAVAAEAVARARAVGLRSTWAVGTESASGIPFGALAHLLPEDLAPLPDLGNLLAAAAAMVVGERAGPPLVVAVDDAHHLDPTSAALIHHLALGGDAFVLVTRRTEDPAPDAVDALSRDGVRIEIGDLTAGEVAILLEQVLGGQVDQSTIRRLWRATHGNPLYLREIVGAGMEDGALSEAQGVWRWQGEFVPVRSVEAAVSVRLASMSSSERRIAEFLAVAEPLAATVLEQLVEPRALVAMEQRGLITTRRDQDRLTVRLVHPLYGRAIRATVSALRRRELYRALADTLERASGADSEHVLRIATWRVEAEDSIQAEIGVAAARRAMTLFDYALAERLARASSHAGFDATVVVATAAIAQGRFEEADPVLARAQQQATTDDQRAATALQRAVNLATNLGRLEDGMRLLEQGEAALASADARDRLIAMRVWLLLLSGHTREAIRRGRALMRSTLPDDAVLFGVGAVIQGLVYSGRTGEAIPLAEEWGRRAMAGTRGTFYDMLGFDLARTLAYLFEGRISEAEAIARPAYQRVVEGGPAWVRAVLTASLGLGAVLRGDGAGAVRLLREGVALVADANTTGQLAAMSGELSHALGLVGDAEGASRALEQARAASTWQRLYEGYVARGAFWTAVAHGHLAAAIEQGLEVAAELGRLGLHAQRAFILHDVARLGEPEKVTDDLRLLAAECDGLLVSTMAEHAFALAERDAAGLEAASRAFEEMGALLLAAEAAAEAGAVQEAAGRRGSAMRLSGRAQTLFGRCTVPPTPALRHLATPQRLSRREWEVATLAARGRSNSQIADELVLSVRTVENHLYRVYQKAGVTRRDDLAVALSSDWISASATLRN
jgi:DNA-binding NarL/FixJ family response regulator